MRREPAGDGERDESVEFVDDDATGGPAPDVLELAPRRVPRWLPVTGLLAVAAVVAFLAFRGGAGHDTSAARSSHPPARPAHSVSPRPATPAGEVDLASPRTARAGHPLLGGGDWNLFALGPGVVVRIQPALGEVTTTPLPALQSSGPVSFVVTDVGALVRPIDFVPGYAVPDGAGPRELGTPLDSGPTFPGPDGRHVWIGSDGGPDAGAGGLVLIPVAGGSGGASQRITLPDHGAALEAVPDGAGFVIFPAVDGSYDATPSGLRRITTGAVLATGRTGWLVAECDARYRCALYRVDRADWSRHAVPFAVTASDLDLNQTGALSPDGTTAAVYRPSAAQPGAALFLLNLVTGRTTGLLLPGGPPAAPGAMAWSPDGRRLFAVTGSGRLAVVDARTGAVSDLGMPLPPLAQLAIRAAGMNR